MTDRGKVGDIDSIKQAIKVYFVGKNCFHSYYDIRNYCLYCEAAHLLRQIARKP